MRVVPGKTGNIKCFTFGSIVNIFTLYSCIIHTLRPRPYKADFLVKPHKSCAFRPTGPDEAGESGARKRTFLKSIQTYAVSC